MAAASRRRFLLASAGGGRDLAPKRERCHDDHDRFHDRRYAHARALRRSGRTLREGRTRGHPRQAAGRRFTSAVLAGAYNIGKSSVLPLFHAHIKDLPVIVLAPAGVYDAKEPFAQLLVAHDSPVTRPRI